MHAKVKLKAQYCYAVGRTVITTGLHTLLNLYLRNCVALGSPGADCNQYQEPAES